jgi:hypothetical protein
VEDPLVVSSADPLREDVEAALRRLAGTATALPCALVQAARRTLAESAGLARTMLNLTVDGLLGWDIDAGVPRLQSTGEHSGPAETRGTRVAVAPEVVHHSQAADLAIPGYEDLAASHIVARLDRLTPSDLAKIRSFEVAHRGRRTVVGKIDQLLARP